MWVCILCSLMVGLAVQGHVFATIHNSTMMAGEVNGRTTGGRDDIETNPFIIQIMNDDEFCGGTIVSDQHILTAAHCVYDVTADSIEVKAGSDIRGEGTDIPIADILLHPEYRPRTIGFDIAVLTTMDRISFNEYTMPILIAPAGETKFDFLDVLGWGYTQGLQELSDYLTSDTVFPFPQDQCAHRLADFDFEENFCSDSEEPYNSGPCKGDDGGPAIKPGFPSVLFGIISIPTVCTPKFPSPGLYTAIGGPDIHSFIMENTDAVEAM